MEESYNRRNIRKVTWAFNWYRN